MDSVNHPPHYNQVPNIECIEVVRHFNFNRGNAIKYIWRAGDKSFGTEIEDLRKAIWYLNDEIKRLEKADEIQGRDPGQDGVIRVTAEELNLVSSWVMKDSYTPPWEDYGDGYKWWAVDSTDRAYFFSEKPLVGNTAWTVSGGGLFHRDEFYDHELKNVSWKETLRERPVR